jgi:hypothetical protein
VNWRRPIGREVDVLKRRGLLGLFAIVALLSVACSTEIKAGSATLPVGIESAVVPDAELGGYMYFSSDPPISVTSERFLTPSEAADLPASASGMLQLSKATIALSQTPKDFSGTLEFVDNAEAERAWSLFEPRADSHDFWGALDTPEIHMVHGDSPWAADVKGQFESGNLVSLEDSDPLAWDLLTNLPESPEKPPLAVGSLTVDGDLLKEVADMGDLQLFGLNTVFGFVGVHNVAFGMYADSSLEVPDELDEEFFKESEVAVVTVSNPGYPGFVVSFLLKMVSGRVGMESIELGDTAARYRTVNDLHLIVKNKGSLLYAVVASTRAEAERLVLSAIED